MAAFNRGCPIDAVGEFFRELDEAKCTRERRGEQ